MTVTSTWTSPAAAGTLDLAAGAVLTEAVWDAMVSNFLWLGGTTAAWVAFTPTMAQSTGVTITVNSARYCIFGKTAQVEMLITTTAGGTGGNGVTVAGIPAAIQPRLTGVIPNVSAVGSFIYSRGGTYYAGTVHAGSTTTFSFFSSVGAATGVFGATPNITVTSGDTLSLQAVYEIA